MILIRRWVLWSGAKARNVPSTESHPHSWAILILLREFTLPMWTHLPLRFASATINLESSDSLKSVVPPTNRAPI